LWAFPWRNSYPIQKNIAVQTLRDVKYMCRTGVKAYRLLVRLPACSRAEEKEDGAMDTVQLHDHARQLWEAHGIKAIAEAAQKARNFEERGEIERARNWRRIEAVLLEMRGPRQG
jgi:hypothetical protein